MTVTIDRLSLKRKDYDKAGIYSEPPADAEIVIPVSLIDLLTSMLEEYEDITDID